jgi:hypothetical protein
MKVNKNSVKKAFIAVVLGGTLAGSQSMFNEVQACDGGCPGPYNKNAWYQWYNGQWNLQCSGVGSNCKTCPA